MNTHRLPDIRHTETPAGT